jgi:hypothetical protein
MNLVGGASVLASCSDTQPRLASTLAPPGWFMGSKRQFLVGGILSLSGGIGAVPNAGAGESELISHHISLILVAPRNVQENCSTDGSHLSCFPLGLDGGHRLTKTDLRIRRGMTKIVAITFGGVLVLFGLLAFVSPALLGAHASPLGGLIHLTMGGAVVLAAQKGGASVQFWGVSAVATIYLLWGLAGFALGQPAESTLNAMPPDLRLLVVVPGFLESGRSDHVFHLFVGIGLGIAAAVSVAENPFRLRK